MEKNVKAQNYSKLQLYLLQSKVTLLDKQKNPWDHTIKYIEDISNEFYKRFEHSKEPVGNQLRFCAFFIKMIEKLQIESSILADCADQILSNYLKYLISTGDHKNVIHLYAQMHSDDRKIRGLAEFSAEIDVN